MAGDRAFTATQTEGKQWALCLDPATGKTLWRTMLYDKENHHQVVGPVSSPVVDGDRVYFIPYKNNNGDIYDIRCPVFCLRAGDGSAVWSEGEKFVSTEGSTPLIVSNTLYISSSSRQSILVAVDKLTGKLLWKTPEPNDAGNPQAVYGAGSSLTYQVVEGIPQIIVSIYRNDNMGVNARDRRDSLALEAADGRFLGHGQHAGGHWFARVLLGLPGGQFPRRLGGHESQ